MIIFLILSMLLVWMAVGFLVLVLIDGVYNGKLLIEVSSTPPIIGPVVIFLLWPLVVLWWLGIRNKE
jgi:hypothetical protein